MSSQLAKKDNLVNTDFWGAAILFFFAIGFYSQMDAEWTHYGQYFPNRILILLVIIGICLVIKGFVAPTRLPSFVSQVNGTMLFTMIVGLVWVFALEWVGFIITSFLAIFAMLWRFDNVRSPKTLFRSALIAAGEVAVIYVGFVKLLYVTMPEGRLFY
jgi:hypothetical protein